jgi:archaeosine synthase beta-subunit
MNNNDLIINDSWIVSRRGKKNPVEGLIPYGWLMEKEFQLSGCVEDVAVVFLTNNECPFRCLMCDLWKNTLDQPVSPGMIPHQIRVALENLPAVGVIKLYNSGSFFDPGAIPPQDYEEIATLLSRFDTVIVESHPAFIGENCLKFKELLKPELQVAMGLEIADDDMLRKLNKKMSLDDFTNAVEFLLVNDILSRAFILLKPPFLDEEEGIVQAERSLEFAFNYGVECCTIIPVRTGNGAMENLLSHSLFSLPKIDSLEKVLEYGISLKMGRVFADLWDLEHFSACNLCFDQRVARLQTMNLYQYIPDSKFCLCERN